MIKTINRNEDIKCPRCARLSKLGEWDDLTYSRCKSREMRRSFVHLEQPKAFRHSSDTFYLCPKCGLWSRGSQLSIISDNRELSKLGGESIFLSEKIDS